MKLSEVYRRAAKLIEDREEIYSCCAVDAVVMGTFNVAAHTAQAKKYAEFFGRDLPVAPGWNDTADSMTRLQTAIDHDRDIRVLLLCFMAAIMESEGK